jgi:hypothetical protein
MKENIVEYHPNGRIKHIIEFCKNGYTSIEFWYDESYRFHNVTNPDYITYIDKPKIGFKTYCINGSIYTKLVWMNVIKKI